MDQSDQREGEVGKNRRQPKQRTMAKGNKRTEQRTQGKDQVTEERGILCVWKSRGSYAPNSEIKGL